MEWIHEDEFPLGKLVTEERDRVRHPAPGAAARAGRRGHRQQRAHRDERLVPVASENAAAESPRAPPPTWLRGWWKRRSV